MKWIDGIFCAHSRGSHERVYLKSSGWILRYTCDSCGKRTETRIEEPEEVPERGTPEWHVHNILNNWPLFEHGIRLPWQGNAYRNYLYFKRLCK